MKTVLFAWELGEGLGHVGPLRTVARELSAKGHRAVFAVRDVVGSKALLKNEGYPVLQAPIWPKSTPRGPFGVAGYADILAIHGFAHVDDLSRMVSAWQDLFDIIKADLVVADHSPTACLAAYGAVPVALIGSGFTLPPVNLPEFPPMRPDIPPTVPEHRLLEIVHEVQRRRKRPAPETLPHLFRAQVRAVCTFPELDPYVSVRGEPVVGPLEPLPVPTALPKKPSLFAYCATEFEAIEELVLCLADMDMPVSVYIRGGQGAHGRFLKLRGIHVYDDPPPLTEVLPKVSAVLSHGGSFVAHAGLTAGRPHLVLPRHLEAELTAKALETLGVGIQMSEVVNKEAIRDTLKWLLHEPKLRDRTLLLAHAMQARRSANPLAKTANSCLELLS